jgi:hypothetical protein
MVGTINPDVAVMVAANRPRRSVVHLQDIVVEL